MDVVGNDVEVTCRFLRVLDNEVFNFQQKFLIVPISPLSLQVIEFLLFLLQSFQLFFVD